MTAVRAARPVPRERFVSASELAEYAYCRRAWWLRAVRGATGDGEGARFDEGRAAHRRHGLGLLAARARAMAAVSLLAVALGLWLMRAL